MFKYFIIHLILQEYNIHFQTNPYGNVNILENIKNMVWDLFHLRMLEQGCAIRMNDKADVNIPYFCTYDRRLLNVKECYELKSMAINYRTGEKYPFYSKMEEIVEYLKEYGTQEQLVARTSRDSNVNLEKVIDLLETEIHRI